MTTLKKATATKAPATRKADTKTPAPEATTLDMQEVETAFVTAMGNGKTATKRFAELVDHAAKADMDTRHIASAITKLRRKGDNQGARVAKKIVGAVFEGATFGKSKDGKTVTIRTKKAYVNADALANLMGAAGDNLTFRDALLKKVKGETTTPKKDAAWVENNAAVNIAKAGIKADLSLEQLLGMVRKAYNAETKVNTDKEIAF